MAAEGIASATRLGDTSVMPRRTSSLLVVLLATAAATALGACSEGFEDTVWNNERGTITLSLFDTGAAWEERYVEDKTGELVLTDGLRFEGVFTEDESSIDVDVRCVSAQGDEIATPCTTEVARKLACTLAEDDDEKLVCKHDKTTVELYRNGSRRVTR